MYHLSRQELDLMPTAVLCEMYHHAQLSYVAAVIVDDFESAEDLISIVIDARSIVMARYGYGEPGHLYFYNEMFDERANLRRFLATDDVQYTFISHRLCRTAWDTGIPIPLEFLPL